MFEIRKSDTVEISKEICIILFIVKYLIFNAKIGEILDFWSKPLFINFKKGGFMGSTEDTAEEHKILLLPGDEIMLCSDGLHKTMPIDVLLEMIHLGTLDLKDRNENFDDNHSFIYIKVD